MSDTWIGVIAMGVFGSIPALSSLIPRPSDDMAIIPAPWVSRDAAIQASRRINASIISISDDTGIVIVRPNPGTQTQNLKVPQGVFLVRAIAPPCGAMIGNAP